MNEKEIAEIRRRFKAEKNNIGRVRGCCVNEKKNIISEFNQMLGLMSSDESEELLAYLRRIFSGSIGRNLINIGFGTNSVNKSAEHKLLSALRDSALNDDKAVHEFYNKAISSIDIEGNYIVLLASDKYDVFTPSKSGEDGGSNEYFNYFVCAVCPIKSSKPVLGYNIAESKFKNLIRDSVMSSPEIGFMFPAFDERAANIYGALFYTKDISTDHKEFTDTVFNAPTPLAAAEQSESIAAIFNETLNENCDLEFVKAVQGQLIELIDDHKAAKSEEPLALNKKDMSSLLRFGGAGEEQIEKFNEKLESGFGPSPEIVPSNVMNVKSFQLKLPEITIKSTPEASDYIKAETIDGTKYIMIRAEGDIEVNGIKINF